MAVSRTAVRPRLATLHEVSGKRVTYSKLTGKEDVQPSVRLGENDADDSNVPEFWK